MLLHSELHPKTMQTNVISYVWHSILEKFWFSIVFQRFWNHDIRNLNNSLDVCKKWSGTPMEILKSIGFPLVFFNNFEIMISEFLKQVWNCDIRILNISLDVWQKWTGTPMELLKNSNCPCRFFMILKSWYQNSWYFNRRVTKMERDTDGTVDLAYVFHRFWAHDIRILNVSLDVWQKRNGTPVPAGAGYEIPKPLCSVKAY